MRQHIPDNELALACELRTEGCRWKLIAHALGYDTLKLVYAVRSRCNTRG